MRASDAPAQKNREMRVHTAPELGLNGSSYEGDIFAFGVIVIQLSTCCDLPASEVSLESFQTNDIYSIVYHLVINILSLLLCRREFTAQLHHYSQKLDG